MTSRKCNPAPLLVLSLALLPTPGVASILGASPLATEVTTATARPTTRPGPDPWPTFQRSNGFRYGVSPNEDSPTTTVELRFPGGWVAFDGERLSDWARRPEPARYGAEWSSRWNGSLTLGFGQIPAGSALSNLDTTRWNSYVQALRSHHGRRLSLVCNDDSSANPAMVRPLGGRTRVLEYDLAPTTPDESAQRVLQVFSETANGVFVMALEGPSDHVTSTRSRLVGILKRTVIQTK